MSRFWVTVEVEPIGQRGAEDCDWPLSMPQQAREEIITRIRTFWPLAALTAEPIPFFAQRARISVVSGDFSGPTEAMFVLGVVLNAFELAGEQVSFRGLSIRAVDHDAPLTVENLARRASGGGLALSKG